MFFKQNLNVSEPKEFAVSESRLTRDECRTLCQKYPESVRLGCYFKCPFINRNLDVPADGKRDN
jgi:hypothetical protein